MPSTQHDIRTLYDRYVAAFGSRNLEAILPLHAEDTQFWLHTGQGPAKGRDGVRSAFEGFFKRWPNLGFEVYRVITGPQHWVLDWAATAEPKSKSGSLKAVRFDCLDVVIVDADGLVTRKDTFVDMVQVQQALGSLQA